MRTNSGETDLLLRLVDEAYDRPAWHGPNLRAALRGVTAAQAAWRPAPGRNTVWQLVLHCAYWKYAVRRKLAGGPRGAFPRAPANFPAVPPRAGAAAWRADLALLDEQHRLLRAAVAAVSAAGLHRRRGRSSAARLIAGIAAHDLYHAGQIRLLARMSPAARRTARR